MLDGEGATVEVGVTAAGLFHVGNANLGTGVFKPEGGIDKNLDWSGGFIAPSAKLTLSSDRVGAFHTGVWLVGAGITDEGDTGGFIHTFQLSSQSLENVTVNALYYIFNFDRKPAGIMSSHAGSEVNIIVDWKAMDNQSIRSVTSLF